MPKFYIRHVKIEILIHSNLITKFSYKFNSFLQINHHSHLIVIQATAKMRVSLTERNFISLSKFLFLYNILYFAIIPYFSIGFSFNCASCLGISRSPWSSFKTGKAAGSYATCSQRTTRTSPRRRSRFQFLSK